MILECTQCHMRYLVPDTAIGPEGRTVRCASCKHSWFQPPALFDMAAASPAPSAGAAVPEPSRAPTPAPDTATPDARPASEARPAPAAAAPAPEAPRFVDPDAERVERGERVGFDAFAHKPPFRPRRNPMRRWTAAAVIAGISMLIGTAAIVYTGAPGIAARIGLPIGVAETPLLFDDQAIERRNLSSGNEVFAVSGRIVNPTGERQRVPDIRVALKDQQDRTVYSWAITPPQRELGPSGSVPFHSAKLDVPANAKALELSFDSGL